MKASKGLLRGMVVAAASAALIMPSAAFAQNGPPAGHGPGTSHGRGQGAGGGRAIGGGGNPGKGGGGGEEALSNNLSVPTIMVNGGFTGVTCGSPEEPSQLVTPTGNPLTGYELDPSAYYYVQGVNSWQAQCYNASSASVFGAWGDNLTGTAKLSVSSPIRVELGLMNSGTASVESMDGYSVQKLEPSKLDRESAYGTAATQENGTFSANPTSFGPTEWRVYAGGVTFSICLTGTTTCPVPAGTPASAEINATGNVVYGYNLRVQVPGDYTITFTTPSSVTFTGADAGTAPVGGTTASLPITVTPRTSGGGGGHGPGGGGGG